MTSSTESGQKLRVLHVIDSLAMGGAERMAADLVNLLDPQVVTVAIMPTRASGPLEDAVADHVPVVVLGRRYRWDLRGFRGLRRFVRENDIDLIHSHGRSSMQFVTAARRLGFIAARQVLHDHFGDVRIDPGMTRRMQMSVRLGVDAYIGVDTWLCDAAKRHLHLPDDRIYFVRNGIGVPTLDPTARASVRHELDIPETDFVITMVANFRSIKDHPLMLRAFRQADLGDRVTLLLIGVAVEPAYHHQCEKVARELGLGARVRFLGPRADVSRILQASDVGALSSRSESGPLALLEYMAAAVPFVVTNTGEIVQAVVGSGAGKVVPPNDATALAHALEEEFRMTPEERRDQGRRGRLIVESQFDQRVTAAQVLEVYRDVLGVPAADQRA